MLMLGNSKGIVLRSVKYGDSSLIVSIFSETYGLNAYMLKGIRSEKNKSKRAGLLHPGSLLTITTEHKPYRQLQHIKEFAPAYLYQQLPEDIVRNCIAVFSVELLQKLLPEAECMEDLFQFCYEYFLQIDTIPHNRLANLPIFFLIQCGRYFGYNVQGSYDEQHCFLSTSDGIFAASPPSRGVLLNTIEVAAIAQLIVVEDYEQLQQLDINRTMRNNLMDWFLEFLQLQTQHLTPLRSLEVLRTILH